MPIMMEAFNDGLYEVASLSRWLFPTLVAINGPAAVSVLPHKMARDAQLAGSLAFLLGILSVLGAGVWSLYAFKRVSIAANTMGYWLTVGGDDQRLAALEATMKRHMDQAVDSRATHIFVCASVAVFLTGCAFTGWGLLSRG